MAKIGNRMISAKFAFLHQTLFSVKIVGRPNIKYAMDFQSTTIAAHSLAIKLTTIFNLMAFNPKFMGEFKV